MLSVHFVKMEGDHRYDEIQINAKNLKLDEEEEGNNRVEMASGIAADGAKDHSR